MSDNHNQNLSFRNAIQFQDGMSSQPFTLNQGIMSSPMHTSVNQDYFPVGLDFHQTVNQRQYTDMGDMATMATNVMACKQNHISQDTFHPYQALRYSSGYSDYQPPASSQQPISYVDASFQRNALDGQHNPGRIEQYYSPTARRLLSATEAHPSGDRGFDNAAPPEYGSDDDDNPVEGSQTAEQSSSLIRIYELRTEGTVEPTGTVTLKGEVKVNQHYSGQG